VSCFGESGGGAKISALMATPAAQGLIHKAIIQSGSQPGVYDRAKATDVALFALEAAGPGDDISALYALSAEQLLAVSDAVQARYGILCFQPVIDDSFMPHQTWEGTAPPESAGIPMIIGINTHEGITFLSRKDRQPDGDEEMRQWFTASFGAPAFSSGEWNTFLASYRRIMPDASRLDMLVAMLTDVWMWQGALHQAQLKIAQASGPVFMYEFGWRTPAFDGQWAVHAVELPFVFGNLTYGTAWDGKDDDAARSKADPDGDRFRVADRIMRSWAAFAHKGEPSVAGLAWPEYDLETRAVLRFDRVTEVQIDPNAERRAAVAGLPFGW
jgi:para-nitrobenzyl esterase